MRIIIAIALTAAFATSACGKSDQAQIAEAKQMLIDQCKPAIRAQTVPGLDVDRYCSCVAERSLAGKTARDLQELSEAAGQQAGMQARDQCLSEQGLALSAPATPTPDAAPTPDANTQ